MPPSARSHERGRGPATSPCPNRPSATSPSYPSCCAASAAHRCSGKTSCGRCPCRCLPPGRYLPAGRRRCGRGKARTSPRLPSRSRSRPPPPTARKAASPRARPPRACRCFGFLEPLPNRTARRPQRRPPSSCPPRWHPGRCSCGRRRARPPYRESGRSAPSE